MVHRVGFHLQAVMSGSVINGITAGLIVGVSLVFFSVSMAALIFKGALTPYLAEGMSLVLSGTVVLLLISALLSSLPNVISCVQDVPVGILAVVAADIANGMQGYPTHQIFATVMGAIFISTCITALLFGMLGRFRLGQLIRFIPYPVIGGFLAGSGWLLLSGGIQVMAGTGLGPVLLEPAILGRWLPGVLFGLLIFLTLRRTSHALAMPALLVGAVTLFYLILGALGGTPTAALDGGWLLGPLPAGQLWKPSAPLAVGDANWQVLITNHAAHLAVVPLVSVLSLLLNTSALEIATGHDADVNRELRAGGIANLLALVVGSPPGFVSVSDSTLGARLGGDGRLLSLVIALVLAVTLLFGATVFAYVPRLVVGGLLAFLGFDFLLAWLYDAWFRLPRVDSLLIWLITVVIMFFGFLAGVAVGLFVAVVLFVINYSQVNVLRHFYCRADYPSYVSRPQVHEQVLANYGTQIAIAELQGYLFFGSAHRLLTQLRERLDDRNMANIQFALLDFRLVTGMDSSVALSFQRFLRYLRESNTELVLTNLSPKLQSSWQRHVGTDPVATDELSAHVTLFPTLDQGLAWCEETLLLSRSRHWHELRKGTTTADALAIPTFLDLIQQVLTQTTKPVDKLDLEPLRVRLNRLDVVPEQVIVKSGEPLDGIFYVEEGEVVAQTATTDNHDLVVRRMQQGSVFGEISFYTSGFASANVEARQSSTLYHLSRQALAELEQMYPALAIAVHHMVARDLSQKLVQSTRALSVLKQ